MNCCVHNDKPKGVTGYFHHKGCGPKWVWARIILKNREYDGRIRRTSILARQRDQDLRGRSFALSAYGAIHVCRCRWTQEQLDAVRADIDSAKGT